MNYIGNLRNQTFFSRSKFFADFDKIYYKLLKYLIYISFSFLKDMITFVIFYKNYTGNLRNQTFFTRSKIFADFEKNFMRY